MDWSAILDFAAHLAVLSFFAIGGAHAVLPDVYRYLVADKALVTGATFGSLVALSQAAPGPNVLVLALLGYQIGGAAAAAIATLAFCVPSSIIAYAYARWDKSGGERPWKRIAKTGLAPLTVGVAIASGCILAKSAGSTGVVPMLIAAATAWLSVTRGWHPLWYIAAGAAIGLAL